MVQQWPAMSSPDPISGPVAAARQPGVCDVPTDATESHLPGARLRDGGLDVVVLASRAEQVEVCLLDDTDDGPQERRWRLRSGTHGLWHGHVPDVTAGQRYGLRAHGPWDPARGLWHNPAKLLLDPYARGVAGNLSLDEAIYPHDGGEEVPAAKLQPNQADSRAYVPHGVVMTDRRAMSGDRPNIESSKRVIYEAHVRGLTMLSNELDEGLRGTYAGMAHPATIEHLRSLGVTTIELLPIQAITSETFLLEAGLINYWGYNTLGFFAPEPRYATQAAQDAGAEAVLEEVCAMVNELHEAGLEVLLDVVYNHSPEAGPRGPSLSLRGLDALTYYRHHTDEHGHVQPDDVTGCGNSLDFGQPRMVQLALDSLRYWADVVGVDGFRFDLATTLGRGEEEFEVHHPFLVALATDPLLSGLTLIAEPWDVGPGGWRTGQFPAPMSDWNDRFRDAVRTFWLADPAAMSTGAAGEDLRELATRLAGSADLFGHGPLPGGRGPQASINYITAHDGFTLSDLVSYSHKHNEANGENNTDGADDNRSWNHGAEGPTDDAVINTARRRSMRNLLGTLLLAAGTPMLTAGDEVGRSQQGNNNAYSQDNEISWVSWQHEEWQEELWAMATYLLQLRSERPVLRPAEFATGEVLDGDELPDLAWFTAEAVPMTTQAWLDPATRVLQMLRSGQPVDDGEALLVLNGSLEDVEVVLPAGREGCPGYELVWDSAWTTPPNDDEEFPGAAPGARQQLGPLSMRLYLSHGPG